ncbi:hypothetical protein AGMMS49525_16710 [Bacteroidia bacterium]|nr:hypothetical protein AGMMS49525_16710 [Bacteroidia bacterium]
MAKFTKHSLQLSELLRLIPEEIFVEIARDTQVDYYAKVLKGKMLFNMLFYAMLTVDKLGQRGLADVFSSPQFRLLFNVETDKETLSHSSVSERLSSLNVEFFAQVYEYILATFSRLYPAQNIAGLQLQRVDSSLVAETSNKLKEGMTCGNEYKKKKMVKYTLNYDGMYGTCAAVHTAEKYANESLALPKNVTGHFKRTPDHALAYVFDRGQSSGNAFSEMKSNQGLLFVGRLMENRKLVVVKNFDLTFRHFSHGELKQDALVRIYTTEETVSKNGKPVRKQVLINDIFRVIRFRPADSDHDILLITNILCLRAETVAQMYRRRWDIEVWFRFLKQELNFSHFLSLNENGIRIVLYMTLIVAMLIRIYKQENQLGYKTAKRRMKIELQELIIAIAVVHSGGDLKRLNLPAP